MFVGGEFYYDGLWGIQTPTIATEKMVFLNGGKACLTVICDNLLSRNQHSILLPSYLCPTILQTIEGSGLEYAFYQVNEDFSIDLEDLSRKIGAFPAVYFINYFGFLHSAATIELFKDYQRQGGIVVEDNAQAAFHNHPTGDFIFNSLRKFIPFDGGYLVTPENGIPSLGKYAGRPNRRLPIIRKYREQLYAYLIEDNGDFDTLDVQFNLAEEYYQADQVVLGDSQEREHIEHLDWPGIKAVRRENYQYLMDRLVSLPEIKPIFPALQPDNMPLGLPVYFSGVSRDAVNEELGNHEIGLTIHWDDILNHPRICRNVLAVDMARRILTLPVDQRTNHAQLDYLVMQLKRAIAMNIRSLRT